MTVLITALSLIILTALLVVAIVSRQKKRYPRVPTLIAAIGIVDQSLTPYGSVLVHGELWSAQSTSGAPINSGTKVRVTSYQNGFLQVENLGL